MAKINRFIIEYTELVKDLKIDISENKPPKYLIKRFVNIVKEDINDPRYEKMCTYPIETILVSAFLAILCNASNWAEISDFVGFNKKWLKDFIPFPESGSPIDDTYRRVFSLIDSNELINVTKKYLFSTFKEIKKCMNKYMKDNNIQKENLFDNKGYRLINIDGKVARGTGRFMDSDKKINNLQTLNVYDASDGITLFSIPIDSKENEIPVAQEIISKLCLNKTIVTMDALHAQHKTFDEITKRHGDFLITLKGNQPDAYSEVSKMLTDSYLSKLKNNPNHHKEEKKDNVLIKEYFMVNFNKIPILKDSDNKWIGCRNIIVYRKLVKKTGEYITLYFITSLNDLDTAVEAINARWDVENLLHRYLDVSFDEDINKTMNANAFNNYSIMNKLCVSLLKLSKTIMKKSMIRMRKSFSYDPMSHLFSILAILDDKIIEEAFKNVK